MSDRKKIRTFSTEPRTERSANVTRRNVLLGIGGVLGAGSAGATADDLPDSTKVPGKVIGPDGFYGSRSKFATEKRMFGPSWALTPLQDSMGTITPSGLHFGIHHGGVPTINPHDHRLLVHGMVEKELSFSMASLRRFPRVSRVHFVECSGNTSSEWTAPGARNVQISHGQMSNSEWTGVPLRVILDEAGLRGKSSWVLAEGADASVMGRSIPLEKCIDDCIVAFGQNGEVLRPEQGFPLRLIVPGFEGNTHVKWLRRLEVGDSPFMTRMESHAYADLYPDGKARRFTFQMGAKSVITSPSGEMNLDGKGFYEISGLAWSGRGRVKYVEVSTNAGKTWNRALLDGIALPNAHVRFRFPWTWNGKNTVISSRCTDERGNTQPIIDDLIGVRGVFSRDHNNSIHSWAVGSDGQVTNARR